MVGRGLHQSKAHPRFSNILNTKLRYESVDSNSTLPSFWGLWWTLEQKKMPIEILTGHSYSASTQLVLKLLQFLNHCRSRISRIKQQTLAPPKSPTLDSYNGRQLIQLT